jgi:hypothetical protein
MNPFVFKPIETAPKDGTRILARMAGGAVQIIWWMSVAACEAENEPSDRDVSASSPGWYAGTYWIAGLSEWMPMPTDEMCEANARFIASAPQLLADNRALSARLAASEQRERELGNVLTAASNLLAHYDWKDTSMEPLSVAVEAAYKMLATQATVEP